MAKSKENNTDVIELDAEEIPLEKTIENALVKQNVTDQVINGLKEKFGSLTLRSLDDKESYLELKDARKVVRQWGILAEKICKTGREDAIKVQKLWLSKEKEILGKIAEVQDPLDVEMKKFEDEQERIEQEKIRRQEEQNIQRQATLSKLGATYQDGHFVLNHISYEAVLIKDSDNDIWETSILPKYQAEYKKNEAEKFAQEKKREEEALALKKQQEEMDRQRKEFEEQQAAFKKQQEELRQQQEEADKITREAENKKYAEEREKRRQKLIGRGDQLAGLGMRFNFQYDAYVFQDVNIDNKTELCLWTDEEWEAKIKEITPIIEQRKKAAEEKRLAEIEKEKQEAVEAAAAKERERILEEQRQQKLKEEQEAQIKAEEALKASDKTKWEKYLLQIEGLILSEVIMKSPSYRNKMIEARKLLNKINNL